jgi:hypothetical protein
MLDDGQGIQDGDSEDMTPEAMLKFCLSGNKVILLDNTHGCNIGPLAPEAMPKSEHLGKDGKVHIMGKAFMMWKLKTWRRRLCPNSSVQKITDCHFLIHKAAKLTHQCRRLCLIWGVEDMRGYKVHETSKLAPQRLCPKVHEENKYRQGAQNFKTGAPGPEAMSKISHEENKYRLGAQHFKTGAPGPEDMPEIDQDKNKGRKIEEGFKIGTPPPEAMPRFIQGGGGTAYQGQNLKRQNLTM